jgi:hypothetical protein
MKKLLILLTIVSLVGCSQLTVRNRENDYARQANVQPISKIPPGSLLSQQVAH